MSARENKLSNDRDVDSKLIDLLNQFSQLDSLIDKNEERKKADETRRQDEEKARKKIEQEEELRRKEIRQAEELKRRLIEKEKRRQWDRQLALEKKKKEREEKEKREARLEAYRREERLEKIKQILFALVYLIIYALPILVAYLLFQWIF